MRYLITSKHFEPYLAQYFDPENDIEKGIIVYDLHNNSYTENGVDWVRLEVDHLSIG